MADQATTIFTAPDQGDSQNQKPATQQSPTKDATLSALVGEGQKYKSVDELAKAYIEADAFVERLKSENADLRQKAASAKTVDDVLQRLEQQKASTQDQGAANRPQGLAADEIAKIVRETVTGLETERSRKDNLLKADAAMKKLFGEKAKEMFEAQAPSQEQRTALMTLASVDPDKFVKLFSPSAPASRTQTDSGSTVNTAALADTNQSARVMDPGCKEYFETLRKKSPKEYYSAANQLAMHKAAQANPEKYFGRKLG